jgi:ATP:corrinoid adenosyltransferase
MSADHKHHWTEIDGAADKVHLARESHDRLSDQVGALSGRVDELARSVQELRLQLTAEREITAAVKQGSVTIPAIVTVLRNRAAELTGVGMPSARLSDFDLALGRELRILADGIEKR